MAKFIKSNFRVMWGTIFSFFAGMFVSDVTAQDSADDSEDVDKKVNEVVKEDKALDPGVIAAAVAAAAALISSGGDDAPEKNKVSTDIF